MAPSGAGGGGGGGTWASNDVDAIGLSSLPTVQCSTLTFFPTLSLTGSSSSSLERTRTSPSPPMSMARLGRDGGGARAVKKDERVCWPGVVLLEDFGGIKWETRDGGESQKRSDAEVEARGN